MLGTSLALLCALSWSLSVILLKVSGAQLHPLALNLLKNTIGLVLLFSTVLIVEGGMQWPSDRHDTAWLLLSGLLGIGIADGLVLRAMQHLKASHLAILECLFAPFVITLSIFMLGERPTSVMLVGGVLIIGAIVTLTPLAGRSTEIREPGHTKGVLLMSAGLLLTAFGIVAVKPLFTRVPLFTLVTIRMAAGVFGSALILGFTQQRPRLRLFASSARPRFLTLFAACFLSSYVSIILWVAGYKYLQASVAALLNQTSTVFTVLFAVIFLKEKMTKMKIVAAALAMAGVALITLGSH